MDNYILEVCADSVESVLAAQEAGADRIELCSNLIVGGTTPSIALFKEVRKFSDIKMNVLLRPRFGDFCYTSHEFNIVMEEVKAFKDLGANGIVIGILKPDGNLNVEQMKILMELKGDMEVTLHRAFDVSLDPFRTLKEAKNLGINTILTSGQRNSALVGKELIKALVEESQGKIDILVGGGVNSSVIKELQPYTGVKSFHMSGKKIINSEMTYRREGINMGLPGLSEFEIWRTDKNKIREAKNVLNSIMNNNYEGY